MGSAKTIILLNKSSLVETKKTSMSTVLNSAGDNSVKIRKRQRLDHLSTEEKLLRRKLKNRVAAQSARDRKKARMDDLEIEVQNLHNKVEKLLDEMSELNDKNMKLEKENEELRKHLNLTDTSVTIKEEPLDTESSPCKDSLSHESLEYASLINDPLLKGQVQWVAILWMTHLVGWLTLNLISTWMYYKKSENSWKIPAQTPAISKQKPVKVEPPNDWWGPEQKSWNPI